MIASAGPGVPSVEHELLGREARLPRILIERGGPFDEIVPVAGRLYVHLDHSRIRGDEKVWQPGIVWRRIALEQHAQAEGLGRGFNGGNQIQVFLDRLQRRHEDVQDSAARLDAQRGTDDAGGRFASSRSGAGAVLDRLWIARLCCRIEHAGNERRGPDRAGMVSPPGGWEPVARRKGIELVERGAIFRRRPGERVERQPKSHRRVAGQQIESSLRKNHRPVDQCPSRSPTHRSGSAYPTTPASPCVKTWRSRSRSSSSSRRASRGSTFTGNCRSRQR